MKSIMVYFVGINGTPHSQSVFVPPNDTSFLVSIPNGIYHVYSIGFADEKFGFAKCGIGKVNASKEITLAGLDTVVSIDLDAISCQSLSGENPSSFFSSPNYQTSSGFVPIDFVSCDAPSFLNVTSYNSTCTMNTPTTVNQQTQMPVPIRSIHVQMVLYELNAGLPPTFTSAYQTRPTAVSACIPFIANGADYFPNCPTSSSIASGTSSYGLPIPVGNDFHSLRIPVGIQAYSSCNCESSNLVRGFLAPLDLLSASFSPAFKMFLNQAKTSARIFLLEPYGPPDFQIGAGP
jgi:hypothetical protein